MLDSKGPRTKPHVTLLIISPKVKNDLVLLPLVSHFSQLFIHLCTSLLIPLLYGFLKTFNDDLHQKLFRNLCK